MKQFSKIFAEDASWRLRRNNESDLVDGVYGSGNPIFESILNSINKYLENNAGSVIDFGLLKDAVDRHCDSIEEDISTQTPVPLYWGLAGTMAGVIIGLFGLIYSGALEILTKNVADLTALKDGVQSLLDGVAWAMLASICGILLTTANSLLFKKCKLEEESGKNSFLAWMQSQLLPELPSDTSQALNNLVKNLNKFNNTFANNTAKLGDALSAVNQSYAIQADIIKAVHDMDVMKMAKANVRVLQELKECTDKLEVFNTYLSDVKGYTDAIHRFETQFGEQADRLHVLEEIRDFFSRHKAEISKTTADADNALQGALQTLKESTSENVTEMHARFVEQSEQFKTILRQEKESFEEFMAHMKTQFSAQISGMPQMARQLEEISAIPLRLDKLIEKIEKSNSKLASDISFALKQTVQTAKVNYQLGGSSEIGAVFSDASPMPTWMKYAGFSAIIIIAIACIFNIVVYFFPNEPASEHATDTQIELVQPVEKTLLIENDTVVKAASAVSANAIVDSSSVGR